ncbi:uncharacterized protein LOC118194766 [Stegodyphus dumicola]|uniref:uncharacterized protein LOC118194766 n=1 Tax=Stegodyphus dumicola TaxID=202533 RepID=UPI0015ADD036|nr:uncharacterized protein LOC118194766 [Stegodyphus dumicola]
MVTHRWNLKGKLLKTLYLQAVERMVLYGCPIWYTGTERQKQKLSQIQRIALLCITKAFSTAPTSALQILAGILPLDLKAKMEAGIYRLHHYKENLQIGDVIIWAQEVEERIPTIGEHPALTQKVRWYKDPPEDNEIEAFTDGSKKDNRVGAAFVIYNNSQEITSKQIRLNDEATVFQAEVVALKEVCKWLSHNADNNTPIKIFTDSQSSLQSLNKIKITSSSIKAFKEIICTLQETHNTVLNWVKAHEGTKGNERADEEAKRATERDTIDMAVPLSELAVKHKIKQELIKQWQERWDSETTGRWTHGLFPTVSPKRIRTNFYEVQALTNHGKFPSYINRFFKKQVKCACGTSAIHANASHYITSCPMLERQRKEIFLSSFSSLDLEHLVKYPAGLKGIRKTITYKL